MIRDLYKITNGYFGNQKEMNKLVLDIFHHKNSDKVGYELALGGNINPNNNEVYPS